MKVVCHHVTDSKQYNSSVVDFTSSKLHNYTSFSWVTHVMLQPWC